MKRKTSKKYLRLYAVVIDSDRILKIYHLRSSYETAWEREMFYREIRQIDVGCIFEETLYNIEQLFPYKCLEVAKNGQLSGSHIYFLVDERKKWKYMNGEVCKIPICRKYMPFSVRYLDQGSQFVEETIYEDNAVISLLKSLCDTTLRYDQVISHIMQYCKGVIS